MAEPVGRTPEQLGVEYNPNMWIGAGWFYCPGCKQYTAHKAYSHPGKADCYEICQGCGRYYP